MIFPILQSSALFLIFAYLGRWLHALRRRSRQTGESLLGELRMDWSARELSDRFLWQEGLKLDSEEAWRKMQGPRGLWVMHQNARVMLRMADYADRHCEGVDRLTIETLRSDAMQIRLCVLMALAQYGFTQASEGVRVNAFRAAEMYTAMAARMTCLLQNHAAAMVPDFVSAM